MSLLRHHPGVRLGIVGGDGQQAGEFKRLERVVKRWGIEEMVIFAGCIKQSLLPAYYSAADLLVVSSHYESFAMVGLEALACGTPLFVARALLCVPHEMYRPAFRHGHSCPVLGH